MWTTRKRPVLHAGSQTNKGTSVFKSDWGLRYHYNDISRCDSFWFTLCVVVMLCCMLVVHLPLTAYSILTVGLQVWCFSHFMTFLQYRWRTLHFLHSNGAKGKTFRKQAKSIRVLKLFRWTKTLQRKLQNYRPRGKNTATVSKKKKS